MRPPHQPRVQSSMPSKTVGDANATSTMPNRPRLTHYTAALVSRAFCAMELQDSRERAQEISSREAAVPEINMLAFPRLS